MTVWGFYSGLYRALQWVGWYWAMSSKGIEFWSGQLFEVVGALQKEQYLAVDCAHVSDALQRVLQCEKHGVRHVNFRITTNKLGALIARKNLRLICNLVSYLIGLAMDLVLRGVNTQHGKKRCQTWMFEVKLNS